jgi:tetratricopeptide (TPR) repeat protein
MARADRRRTRRSRPPAAVRSGGAGVAEQPLFFQRLRGSAKWVFVFLALVFAVSFVAFGVGSEVPGGVADILGRSPGASGQVSAEDARERARENPRNAQAWRDLATALQQEGRPEDAVSALDQYVSLKPRDANARRELAGLYLGQATRLRTQLQEIQFRAQFDAPGDVFLPSPTTPLGQALGSPPISAAVSGGANEQLGELYSGLQTAYEQAKLQYAELANLEPEDASVQLQLADAAVNAGDTAAAVAAFERFLELAPDDPSAPLVREELKRLEASSSIVAEG